MRTHINMIWFTTLAGQMGHRIEPPTLVLKEKYTN